MNVTRLAQCKAEDFEGEHKKTISPIAQFDFLAVVWGK